LAFKDLLHAHITASVENQVRNVAENDLFQV